MPTNRLLTLCCLFFGTSFAGAAEPLTPFTGLGTHTRTISTTSPEAQEYFDQGLAFLYGFNHDEAQRLFALAAQADPKSPMPHYMIALSHGPNINFPMVDERHGAAAWEALQAAQERAKNGTPIEQELIAALAVRYAKAQPEDRRPLDEAFAAAMRKVWQRYPNDTDVGAIFAESLMDLWPWNLWTKDGQPQADTDEVLATLEAVMRRDPNHPLAIHLYIHALEASPFPERAKEAADRMRNLVPGLGHQVHMPSHIDVRLGAWQQAIDANEKSIVADAKYRELSPEQDFFRIYMAHNHHMLAFAAIMQGQSERSTVAIDQMLAEIPGSWLEKNAPFVDGMFCMPYEVHLRFGRWEKMLAEPEPQAILPISRCFWRYARGVAYAAKGNPASARKEQALFRNSRDQLPEEAMFVQNTAADVLKIADAMLEGEILYREGKVDAAIASLRAGVKAEDALRYIEPPDWMQPVRHVLGATLMDAKRYAEAEAVYRDDLKIHPHNGWSLHGLAASLLKQGKRTEAQMVDAQFREAWKRADVELPSSCFCLPLAKE